MKHLKRYNEEANPIEWVKGKIKSNKANKSLSKGIDKVKKMMSEVKIPNAEISELDQSNWSVGKSVDSKPVYVSFNVTTKTNNNIHTNLEFNLLSYLNDDGNLRAWSEEGEMKLVCDNIIFQKIVKFEKKAGYYSSYNGYKNFYDNDLGRIDMGEDYISIANQGGHGNLDDVENYGLVNSSKEIKDFISKLNEMQNAVNEVSSIVDELQKPKTATELKEFANNESYKARIEHYKKLKEKIEELSPYINQMLNNFKSEDFKKNQIEESGWLTKQIDKARVFHGGKGLIADDFDDVVRSMSPYMESLKYIESVLNTSNNIEDNVKQKLSTTENKKEQPVKEEDPFRKHFSI